MQIKKKVQVQTDLKTIAGNPVTLCMDPNFTTITTCLIQRGEPEDQFDKKKNISSVQKKETKL